MFARLCKVLEAAKEEVKLVYVSLCFTFTVHRSPSGSVVKAILTLLFKKFSSSVCNVS
jgi:hypothetical protein